MGMSCCTGDAVAATGAPTFIEKSRKQQDTNQMNTIQDPDSDQELDPEALVYSGERLQIYTRSRRHPNAGPPEQERRWLLDGSDMLARLKDGRIRSLAGGGLEVEQRKREIEEMVRVASERAKETNKPWGNKVVTSAATITGDPHGKIDILINASKLREQASAAFIWAHPGGGIALSAEDCNEFMVRFAHKFRCITFTVDYRLAPEHKLPKAHRDFMHTFLHVYANAQHYDVDRSKIVIGGDEAGAFICLSAAQLMSIENRKEKPRLMLLRSPMLATAYDDGLPKKRKVPRKKVAPKSGKVRPYPKAAGQVPTKQQDTIT